jgi:hypothetical protein
VQISVRAIVVAAFVVGLVAGTPGSAPAKKKLKVKNALTATIDGTAIKFPKNVRITAGGTTVAFMVLGQTRIRGHVLRTFAVACGDFPPGSIPGTSTHCTAQYNITKVGRHPSSKLWFNAGADQTVTFLQYDGSLVEGTLTEAALPSVSGDPSVSVDVHFIGRIAGTH